jgi:hypothetical protein
MKTLRLAAVVSTFLVLGFGLTVVVGSGNAQQQNEGEENIRFLWAFGAIKKGQPEAELIPVTRDMALKTGDQIKFFLKPEEKCFLYLIYHSSQGDLYVLFPYRFEQLGSEDFMSGYFYIPQGDQWFELDEHVGQEIFYLLASAKRLGQLESLINNYETADRGKKPAIVKKILTEIRRLRWEHRRFKTLAERPVTTIGNVRGTKGAGEPSPPDVAKLAVEISGTDFYSRTFTIDHQ